MNFIPRSALSASASHRVCNLNEYASMCSTQSALMYLVQQVHLVLCSFLTDFARVWNHIWATGRNQNHPPCVFLGMPCSLTFYLGHPSVILLEIVSFYFAAHVLGLMDLTFHMGSFLISLGHVLCIQSICCQISQPSGLKLMELE